MSTLFLPATVKQYRDTVVAKPKEMWAIRAYGSYYWRVVQFSIAYRKSRRRFELNLKNLAELGVETKTVNEAVDLLKRIIPPEWLKWTPDLRQKFKMSSSPGNPENDRNQETQNSHIGVQSEGGIGGLA
jgi:hypothetical protein